MNALHIVFRLGLLIGLATEILVSSTIAQTTPSKKAQPSAGGLRKLTGDDARRAEELNKAIEAALKDDHWDQAIKRAEELLADDHPLTAESYNSVADNLSRQGKDAQVQTFYENALEMHRRRAIPRRCPTTGCWSTLWCPAPTPPRAG